eukprot:446063_1
MVRPIRKRGSKRGAPRRFLPSLWDLLMNEEVGDVIKWSPEGDCFFVYDPCRFERDVGMKYFKHAHFSSFQRQLNLYGFKKIDGAYHHEYFKRENPENIRLIMRGTQQCSYKLKSPPRAKTNAVRSNTELVNLTSNPEISSCATFSTKSYLGMGNGVKESIDSVVRGAIIDLQKGHSKSSAENQLKSIPEEGDSIFIGDTHLEHHKAVFQKATEQVNNSLHKDLDEEYTYLGFGDTINSREFDILDSIHPTSQLSFTPMTSFSLVDEVRKMEAARLLSSIGTMRPSFHNPSLNNQDINKSANGMTMEEGMTEFIKTMESISSGPGCSTGEDRSQLQEAFQWMAQQEHLGKYDYHWKQARCEPRVIDVNAISLNGVEQSDNNTFECLSGQPTAEQKCFTTTAFPI